MPHSREQAIWFLFGHLFKWEKKKGGDNKNEDKKLTYKRSRQKY